MSVDKDLVPAAVLDAFSARFPDSSVGEWDAEYEVEFETGGQEVEATFDADGTLLELAYSIEVDDLPAAVTEAVAAKYAGAKIDEAERLERPGRADVYELELELGAAEFEIHITPEGRVIAQAEDL